MPKPAEISPNEPDILPEYVDTGKSVPVPPATEETPPAPPPAPPVEAAADAEVPAASAPAGSRGHREGECVPNTPDARPELVDESRLIALPPGGPSARPDFTPPASPWLHRHLVATVLAVAVLGIVVFGQAISALALAATLPPWAQYALLIPLGACCLAVLWVCGSLIRSWFRLRAVRQIDIAALEELRRRAATRRDGLDHFRTAREQLHGYLERYPLTDAGYQGLLRAGLTAENIEALAKSRDILLDRPIDSRSWLEEFRSRFQDPIDRAAAARVRSWSLKAAGSVVFSPIPLLDAMLVLGISFRLIGDLCALYNVRSSRAGTLVILRRAVTAAFIAGVAENATETAAEELAEMAGETTLGALGARVAGFVGPKLAEGAVNGLFIRRLGRATISLLQPLKK